MLDPSNVRYPVLGILPGPPQPAGERAFIHGLWADGGHHVPAPPPHPLTPPLQHLPPPPSSTPHTPGPRRTTTTLPPVIQLLHHSGPEPDPHRRLSQLSQPLASAYLDLKPMLRSVPGRLSADVTPRSIGPHHFLCQNFSDPRLFVGVNIWSKNIFPILREGVTTKQNYPQKILLPDLGCTSP